jgi:GPH family glycoside/pentoside/hexuronide:cation symporter
VKQLDVKTQLLRASFGSREMFSQWFTSAFGLYTFFFYESVIGLPPGLAFAAFLVFAVWNAVNDPIAGYLMEKLRMPWQRKRHFHRFPWILIGGIPWIVSYLVIFLVPLAWQPPHDTWKIFGWYVGSLLLFDTFFTLYEMNATSLFPVKFRKPEERRAVQGWGTFLGILGLVLAFVITGMIVNQSQPESYRLGALVSFGGGFLLFALLLPGVYETKQLRARYAHNQRLTGIAAEPFFSVARKVLSSRTVRVKYIFFFGYQSAVALVNASAMYVIAYILNEPANQSLPLIMGSMLVGAAISVPLWVAISQRVNDNKRMSIAAGLLMFASFVPMVFAVTRWQWMATLVLFGVSLGGQWFMDPPTMGDVLDDAAVRTGKREQSIYYGYQTFIVRFGEALKAGVIALAHIATGFVGRAPTLAAQQAANPEGWRLAVFGIRIHTAIVPALLVLAATIIFWRRFDLTPEKTAANRKKLEAMGI